MNTSRSPAKLQDVARLAGVGLGSASRVMANSPHVSQRTRQRVLDAAAALGYEPNLLARAMRGGNTGWIGLIASDIHHPGISAIISGGQDALNTSDVAMILAASDDSPLTDLRQFRLLKQRQVDGVVCLLSSETNKELNQELASSEIPIVLVDREFKPPTVDHDPVADSRRIGLINSNHRIGLDAAIQHLLDLDHRNIGVLVGRNLRPARERVRAVKRALAERQYDGTLTVLRNISNAKHVEDGLRELLTSTNPPSALILGGQMMIYPTCNVFRAMALTPGEEVSIVSCDDSPTMLALSPTISTVARDYREMGRMAVTLLLDLIAGDSREQSITLPTVYIPRQSTRAA